MLADIQADRLADWQAGILLQAAQPWPLLLAPAP
jgi:hypothetical protein